MAKRTPQRAKRRRSQTELMREDEARVRRLAAQLQARHLKATLATYQAADKGRRNKDWRPRPNASADLGILPDAETLNARARALVRDSWIARSAIRAACRSVVGSGIIPVPNAKDEQGVELRDLNAAAEREFWLWASDREACDTEKRQTWWQKQAMAVSERWTVGEHFIVWSYEPNKRPDGTIDLSKPVGLRLQSYEPEQLDLTLQNHNGNEVRGGVELDERGAAVAYWFYERAPNDYLGRRTYKSIRIPRARVLHYFKQERTLQTRGVTEFAPVMQRIRDYHRRDDAEMWAAIMEACIGLVITKNHPTGPGLPPTLPYASGDTGETGTGMRTADFVPGMVFEGSVGEDVKPFAPSRPGGTYEPYAKQNLRGIAAGLGMSYGQLSRQSESNYSAARQDMLTDMEEVKPERDLHIDTLDAPVYELFFRLSALEGRFDGIDGFDFAAYMADPRRYHEAEYIPPAQPWIDPEKEANAYEKMLALRLTTRRKLLAMHGERFVDVMDTVRDEREQAASRGIILPEDADSQRTASEAVKNVAEAGAKDAQADAADNPAELMIRSHLDGVRQAKGDTVARAEADRIANLIKQNLDGNTDEQVQ